MKNKIIKFVAIYILTIGVSCSDYLDVVPDNIAVIEDAFKTRDNAFRFLHTLYGYMPEMASINNPALLAGDEVFVNINVSRNWPARRIATGGQSITNPQLGYWGDQSIRNLFIALRDCNIFLNNIDKPFDITDLEKRLWIAEAKTLKAYYHFYLLRMYGPIPIIRENIEVSEGVDAVRVSRDPADDVANYIVELLDEAILDLPSTIVNPTDDLGRLTKPIAAGIKAKVLVTIASPLFNGNSSYSNFVDKEGKMLISQTVDENKWTKAKDACLEAIEIAEASGHKLYEFKDAPTDWDDATVTKLSIRGSISESWNDEVIWGSSQDPVNGLQRDAQARVARGLTNAVPRESVNSYWAPTMRIAEMFYSENGVPIEEDNSYDYTNRFSVGVADATQEHYVRIGYETAKLHLNREPRFYASLGFDGGIWEGHGEQTDDNELFLRAKGDDIGGKTHRDRWSVSGYWAKKLVNYENVQSITENSYSINPYPFPVIRLADLYLLCAEALNETGNTNEAHTWIDKVRKRAGLNGVVDSWAAAAKNPSKPNEKNGLREIIQQERMIELVFEGQRFWDLKRWKRSSEFMNNNPRGWNVSGETTQDYYNVITTGVYSFLQRDIFGLYPRGT